MENEINRVDGHLLEYIDDALTLDGVLFTGICVVEYSSGKTKQEHSYVDGFPNGLCRDWYESGQLKSEWIALKGEAPAEVTEWFEDGALKSKKISEHGVEIQYEEWDNLGNLIVSRELEPDSPMHSFLERMRKVKTK